MKKLLLILTLMVMGLSNTNVQAAAASRKESTIVESTFDAAIHCESCKRKVLNVLPFQRGVKTVNVDVAKQKIKVSYDSRKSSDEMIVASLKKIDIPAHKEDAKHPERSTLGHVENHCK